MKNKLKMILILLGVVLVGVSIALTLVSSAKVNIIGGAGWPTLWFFFRKNAWIACMGVLLILGGIFVKK